MKILIIEEEPELAANIGTYLSAQAREKVELDHYECILLDLMLPGGDGFRACMI